MKKVLFLKSAGNPIVIKYAEIRVDQVLLIDEFTQALNVDYKASTELFNSIDILLEENDLAYADIDQIYVASGPGSYTAARLLVTLVKTIAFIYPQIEVFDASILDVFLHSSKKANSEHLDAYAATAARKNRYYFAAIEAGKRLDNILLSTAKLIEKLQAKSFYLNGTFYKRNTFVVEEIPLELDLYAWFSVSQKIENIALYEPYYLEKVKIG